MTHCGQPQTFASSLPTLLRLSRAPGKVAGILGCQCGDRLHAVPDHAREIRDLDWSHCPLDLIGSPYFKAVETLARLAKTAPLQGWPDRYAAWAVYGTMALREHRGEV